MYKTQNIDEKDASVYVIQLFLENDQSSEFYKYLKSFQSNGYTLYQKISCYDSIGYVEYKFRKSIVNEKGEMSYLQESLFGSSDTTTIVFGMEK